MKLSMHTMAVDTFAPMLTSLSEILDKAIEYSKKTDVELVDARLTPDMYTLAQQVQQATYHARDCVSRLTGQPPAAMPEVQDSLDKLKQQIEETVEFVRSIPAGAFEGSEDRDCSNQTPRGNVIDMDGERFLRSWAIPHFYFHVVTAYDILRKAGLSIGKTDYLSQVREFIRDR